MKTKKKALLTSIMTIVLCISLIAGSTYALFTTSDELNVSVTAGQVKLTAVYDTSSMLTWSSLYQTEADARTDGYFDNSGTARFVKDAENDYSMVVIDRMTPGDVAKFKIDVTNMSNVNVQYRVRMISLAGEHEVDLTEALTITAYIDGALYPVTGSENASVWRFIDADQPIEDIWVTIAFRNTPMDLSDLSVGNPDNHYQNAQAKMTFVVEAVQGNAQTFNSVKDFENEQALMQGNNGYIAEGIHNGEGAIIPVTTEAIGLGGGTVTLSNMTLDGTNSTDIATLFAIAPDPENAEDSTLILADGAKVVATAVDGDLNKAINAVNVPGQAFTLIVDENAKITASGDNAAAVVIQGGTNNIVLNGSGLIETKNGAYGIVIYNYEDVPTVVNIFVKDEAAMREYKALIDYVEPGAIIYWYIDGTAV